MTDEVPPCVQPGQAINTCARSLYAWRVEAKGYLPGEWAGWRLAGRYLVSPDGDRISPERIRGIIFRDYLEKRRARNRPGAQSVGQGAIVQLQLRPRVRYRPDLERWVLVRE